MKKEWLLLLASALVTIIVVLAVVRWFAPHLLGVPTSLQLVQIDTKVPPFFEGVFREADSDSSGFLLKDPLTNVRARPLFFDGAGLGPHDILGFRNRNVPNVADIVVIGDSQTYGNNVDLQQNWPSQMSSLLSVKGLSVYSMATGGWGAVQYLDMFAKAGAFQPKVVVIAFYSGNDPLDSFSMAYGVEHWNYLIPDSGLSQRDAPKVEFPAPQSEWWAVAFGDRIRTVFTPTLRLLSNRQSKVVNAGYAIMEESAKQISEMAKPYGIQVVFTIIPTKELVYRNKISAAGFEQPQDYSSLVTEEQLHIDWLTRQINKIPGVGFIDVVNPLQEAAMDAVQLYPENINGHPIGAGYSVIGATIAKGLENYLSQPPDGMVLVRIGEEKFRVALIRDGGIRFFKSTKIVASNGWPLSGMRVVSIRDIAGLEDLGIIDVINPELYGPGNK